MLNRFASPLWVCLLAAVGLSGCAFHSGNEVWDGRDPFAEAAKTAPLTDEFKQRFGLGLTLLVAAQEGNGSVDEAQAHWLGLTTDYPQYPGVWVNYGLTQMLTADYAVAVLAYQEALTINPAYCDALNLRAVAEREQGLFADAQTGYESAISCDPQQGDYYYNLGILFDLYRNDLESALTAYRKARRLMPDDERLDVWIVDLARRSDQPEEDPQAIDDWYFNLTGSRAAEPEAPTEADAVTSVSEEVGDGSSAEVPAELPAGDASEIAADDAVADDVSAVDVETDSAAEDAAETETPAVQYNERYNPFLPDDSATEPTQEETE